MKTNLLILSAAVSCIPALGAAPSVSSVLPINASGTPLTFTATYTDPAGAADLSNLYLMFGTSTNGVGACWIIYVRGTNTMYLMNDTAGATAAGSVTPGVGGSASNSQCAIGDGGAAVATSSTTLKVPVAIIFPSSFKGVKNVYALAAGLTGLNSGWQWQGTWQPITEIRTGTAVIGSCKPVDILSYSIAYGPDPNLLRSSAAVYMPETLTLVKNPDACSPLLYQWIAGGANLSTVVITMPGGSGMTETTLTNAVITQISNKGYQEQIVFSYQKRAVVYK